jgi:hypothetical protein
MILVDSSVWIGYLRGADTRQTERLDVLLGAESVAIGDLILTEVLQGVVADAQHRRTLALLLNLPVIDIVGERIAIRAAQNFRRLRARGVTVRKTVDTLIATRCIVDDLTLLHDDRNFDPFVRYLGLRSVF